MTARQTFSALALILATATAAAAQTPQRSDRGWLPWQGCWRAEDAPVTEQLCIAPEGAGVRMITLQGNVVRGESKVLPDGRARAVNQEGCSGSERASWSADGQRVFLISELNCEGSANRRVTGIFAITGPSEWLSAQSVEIDDQVATRSVRYLAVEPRDVAPSMMGLVSSVRAAARNARETARVVDADDVTEAVNAVDAAAVDEWLTASGQPFQLADDLLPVPQQQSSGYGTSALELVSRGSSYAYPLSTREVVTVIERPTVVHHTTYVNTAYRSCWDPWFAGYVSIGYGVHFGTSYGHYGNCGRHYYSRYSPWGYDLWGWRHIDARPVIIVRGGTPFIHRPPINRDWGSNRNTITRSPIDRTPVIRGTATSRDDDADRPRVTRSGYTSGGARPQPDRRNETNSATSDRSAYTNRPTSRSQSQSQSTSSAPGATSRGYAVPRGSTGNRAPAIQQSAPRPSSTIRGEATPRPSAAPRPESSSSRPQMTTPSRPSSGTPVRTAKPRGGASQ